MTARGKVARIVTTAAAAAVLAAACASTPAASPTAPAPTPTATAVPTPTYGPGDVTPPPSDAATAPAGSPGADASPAATPVPLPTMGPAELALVDRLPTQVLDVKLDREAHSLAVLSDSGPGWKQFVEFSKQLGLDPKDVIVGYAFLADGKAFKEKYGKASFLYGAFQFAGADPATLPEAFLKVTEATQPGTTSRKETIAGREVYVIDPGNAAEQATKSYMVFVGDTAFFGGSDDTALRDAIVSAFPQ